MIPNDDLSYSKGKDDSSKEANTHSIIPCASSLRHRACACGFGFNKVPKNSLLKAGGISTLQMSVAKGQSRNT